MTLAIQGDYTNGTAADGAEITAEFNYIYAGINTHAAASPADHPNGSISADKLASNSVTTIKINADAVDGTKIADDSIDSEHYVDGSIDTAHIAASQITPALCAAGVAGWHGGLTRIKILPNDFISTDGSSGMHGTWQAAGGSGNVTGDKSVNAYIAIPTGYTATAVRIYGHLDIVSKVVSVYECNIAANTCTAKGNGTPLAEINITDVASSATNFLMITVEAPNNGLIYGGYVTIAEV